MRGNTTSGIVIVFSETLHVEFMSKVLNLNIQFKIIYFKLRPIFTGSIIQNELRVLIYLTILKIFPMQAKYVQFFQV